MGRPKWKRKLNRSAWSKKDHTASHMWPWVHQVLPLDSNLQKSEKLNSKVLKFNKLSPEVEMHFAVSWWKELGTLSTLIHVIPSEIDKNLKEKTKTFHLDCKCVFLVFFFHSTHWVRSVSQSWFLGRSLRSCKCSHGKSLPGSRFPTMRDRQSQSWYWEVFIRMLSLRDSFPKTRDDSISKAFQSFPLLGHHCCPNAPREGLQQHCSWHSDHRRHTAKNS